MAALVAQLKAWRPTLLVTISPFDDVWHHYGELLRVGPAGRRAGRQACVAATGERGPTAVYSSTACCDTWRMVL